MKVKLKVILKKMVKLKGKLMMKLKGKLMMKLRGRLIEMEIKKENMKKTQMGLCSRR
jgi:hypothetical protein